MLKLKYVFDCFDFLLRSALLLFCAAVVFTVLPVELQPLIRDFGSYFFATFLGAWFAFQMEVKRSNEEKRKIEVTLLRHLAAICFDNFRSIVEMRRQYLTSDIFDMREVSSYLSETVSEKSDEQFLKKSLYWYDCLYPQISAEIRDEDCTMCIFHEIWEKRIWLKFDIAEFKRLQKKDISLQSLYSRQLSTLDALDAEIIRRERLYQEFIQTISNPLRSSEVERSREWLWRAGRLADTYSSLMELSNRGMAISLGLLAKINQALFENYGPDYQIAFKLELPDKIALPNLNYYAAFVGNECDVRGAKEFIKGALSVRG